MNFNEFKEKFGINLNNQQEQAVQSVNGHILLLAVPGSGKTTVLVTRLAYMIYCENINPSEILTLTYTVSATKDMKQRYQSYFGDEFASSLVFRTINGVCQSILNYYGKYNNSKPFDIDENRINKILKNVFLDVRGEFPTEGEIKDIKTAITYVKNMRCSKDEIEKINDDIENFSKIYESYNQKLSKQKLMDYDDQMIYSLKVLTKYPEILSYFQNRYKYICVDEAQDTSKIQHQIIDLLSRKSGNLFMVGDEDQSIYGFRAAYPDALVNFDKNYSDAKVMLMETNYRSTKEIVESANKLIQQNKYRHKKQMKAVRNAGRKVYQIEMKSRTNQYYYLAKVAKGCNTETAVLYRNNESVLPLIDILDKKEIPYRLKGTDMPFFYHPIVSDICDFLRYAIEPNNADAFLRIYYKMGIMIKKDIVVSLIKNHNDVTLLHLLLQYDEITYSIKNRCKELIKQFAMMKEDKAGSAINRVVKNIGYFAYASKNNLDVEKIKILQYLANGQDSIQSFLDRLEELQNLTYKGSNDENCNFILSTIHSSKGLEYDTVYLMDMVSGILPSCDEEDDLTAFEEERRLYYVGMTRAKNNLNIFTFGADSSEFSLSVFAKSNADKKEKSHNSVSITSKDFNYPKSYKDFKQGGYVKHKVFGMGVITNSTKETISIQFKGESTPRNFLIDVIINNNLLKIIN